MQEPATETVSEPTTAATPTSRQDLVVPPRQSSLPLLLGAVLCAGTGFGLVWAFGVGRSTAGGQTATTAQDDAPLAAAGQTEIAFTSPAEADGGTDTGQTGRGTWEPKPFPPADPKADPPRAMNEPGWRPPAVPASSPETLDRYPTRSATLETPDNSLPSASPTDGAASRFTAPGRFPGTGNEPVRLASAESSPEETALGPDSGDSELPEQAVTSSDASVPDASVPDASVPEDTSETQLEAHTPQASGEIPADDMLAPRAAEGDGPADAPSPPPPAAPEPFPHASTTRSDLPPPIPPAPTPPAFSPSGSPRELTSPAAGFTSADVAPNSPPPASFRPATAAAPVINTAAMNPFASAPPMGPAPRAAAGPDGGSGPLSNSGSQYGSGPLSGSGASGPAVDTTGQGRPGPMQLEGLQTPQMAVEKRGPREIQVGKPARYEILVRNVGTATALDVTLRDAVPYGTTLITTTPPASPVGAGQTAGLGTVDAAAALLWPLGTLAPGGEARVSMEVMPQIEGEIGSVASVSFRTEASTRSRATKPALTLETSEAKAVRIGGEIKLSLKVSNPGTGIATGVVIEGLLPDGVSHAAGRELEFDVGQLRSGESRTIDLVMGSTGPGVHTAQFAARADGQLEVEQPVRLEVTAPTLELSAEMPSRRYLQRPATCVLSMVNAGTAPARSIELAAQLPAGMKFVRANHAGWYEERSHRVLWNLEELPPGEAGTVEMVVMPVDLGPQKIVAAARSSDGPSDQMMHTVEVEGLAALFFEVTDSEDPIEVGGMTEYIVRIGNQGTKAAGGVRLTATLLGDLEPVDAKGPAAHHIENLAFVFDPLAKLAPSEEAVFRIRVRGRREGDQRMQVQLVSDDHPAPITKEEITRVYADR